MLALFGSSKTLPSNTGELLNYWSRPPIWKTLENLDGCAILSVLDYLDSAVFEEGTSTTQSLKLSFAYTSWSWTKVFPDLDSCSVNDSLGTVGVV